MAITDCECAVFTIREYNTIISSSNNMKTKYALFHKVS